MNSRTHIITNGVLTGLLVAGAGAFVAPAEESSALECSGSSIVESSAQVPVLVDSRVLRTREGTPLQAYSGLHLPQAVVQDTLHDQTDIAYFEPVPISDVGPTMPQQAALVVAVVKSGVVVQKTALTIEPTAATARYLGNRGKGPFLFDQSGEDNVDDSHNAVTMAVDRDGFLHVSGGVHNGYLTYWRSADATGNIVDSLGESAMTWRDDLPGLLAFPNDTNNLASGADNGPVSYPNLFLGPRAGASASSASSTQDELYLSFRNGISANGDVYMYRYNVTTQSWSGANQGQVETAFGPQAVPLLEGKTVDIFGQPTLNAAYPVAGSDSSTTSPYPSLPVRAPDGKYWMTWVWRTESSDADSNMRLSSAWSFNLSDWYTLNGTKLPQSIDRALPDSNADYENLVVDDIPIHNGLLNDQVALSFDSEGIPVVSHYQNNVNSRGVIATQLWAATTTGLKVWKDNPITSWSGTVSLNEGVQVYANTPGWLVPGTTDLQIPYVCNGTSRIVQIRHGKYNGALAAVADGVASTRSNCIPSSTNSLVSPSDSGFSVGYTDGTTSGLTCRAAVSPWFTAADGGTDRWFLAWDAAKDVVNGSATVPNKVGTNYPAQGSPLQLDLVSGSAE